MSDTIEQTIKESKTRFTLILGSGYHRQALGKNSTLSNWELLLAPLSKKSLSSNYILEFENIIAQQTRHQVKGNSIKANEIEKIELNHIIKRIKHEQQWVLDEQTRFNYPDIFNANLISDVISLNFDTIAEQLYKSKCNIINKGEFQNTSSFEIRTPKGSKSESFISTNTSYREVKNKDGQSIRFWYPHGSIHKPQHIVLGVSKYASLISKTQEIRSNYKSREVEHLKKETVDFDKIDLTWFSQILNQPVLILGASMSEMEWAMWTAFVHRKRNFARQEMKRYETPVFMMLDKNQQLTSPQNEWFQPLFENMDFNEQWRKLEEIINSR